MSQLIAIATDAQGTSVVSARTLYEGLGHDLSQWSRWHKKNIINNKWAVQETDWVYADGAEVFDMMSKTSEGGRPTVDFAITLDFAKRLCMMARTDEGEKYRQYFIDCEKQLRQHVQVPPALSTTEQLFLQVIQQNGALLSQQQTMLNQQQLMLEQLRADVRQIQAGGKPRRRPADVSNQVPLFNREGGVPADGQPVALRERIVEAVTRYSGRLGVNIADTYRYLYRRMLDVHQLNVWNLKRQPGQSYLDAIEQYGQLERLHTLVIAELTPIT